jgi:hypothetical protein
MWVVRVLKAWIVVGAAAIVVVGGGAYAGSRYYGASQDLGAATTAIHDGAYALALRDLSAARSSWPWTSTGTSVHQINTLRASRGNYRSGVQAWNAGNFAEAQTYLTKVAQGAPDYDRAKHLLNVYRTAEHDGRMVSQLANSLQSFTSAVTAFDNQYNTVIEPLNSAWDNYSIGYGVLNTTAFVASLSQAQPLVSQLDTDTEAVATKAASVSGGGGAIEQNPVLTSPQLSGLLGTIADEVDQVNAMDAADDNYLTDLQNLGYGTGSTGNVASDIGGGNTALAKLEADQQTMLQQVAAVYGFDKSAIDKLVGVSGASSAFISSSGGSSGVS